MAKPITYTTKEVAELVGRGDAQGVLRVRATIYRLKVGRVIGREKRVTQREFEKIRDQLSKPQVGNPKHIAMAIAKGKTIKSKKSAASVR